jgi:hypothetical protein
VVLEKERSPRRLVSPASERAEQPRSDVFMNGPQLRGRLIDGLTARERSEPHFCWRLSAYTLVSNWLFARIAVKVRPFRGVCLSGRPRAHTVRSERPSCQIGPFHSFAGATHKLGFSTLALVIFRRRASCLLNIE